ncbi:hypothetical protein [Thermomonospora umbrina]|uniref:Uncharacterized protein n=1 Tax=Thermomonospora umbrina TaxID=111806 RepID=A0A3D9SWZ3_9ACTN|nr:hypothetical protein [Thermomonospora umbrina]REF00359.1 hypothetical protein DFJ69_5891 [Thermomonospora umbrina]
MARKIRPDDEDPDIPFSRRWNVLVNALLVESSVKLVARVAMDYANYYDRDNGRVAGGNVYPGNELLARETGLSERSVRTAWAVLRGLDMAERTSTASYDPKTRKRTADEYQLMIPEGWEHLPILGPNSGRFRCVHCECLFNPQGNSSVDSKGRVSFQVHRLCFCPPPRDKGKGEGCFSLWTQARQAAEATSWRDLGGDVWKLFREARDDDW